LVEASLLQVQAEDGPGGESRFSLLETIREYGVEQLVARGEEAQTRERHAAWGPGSRRSGRAAVVSGRAADLARTAGGGSIEYPGGVGLV
jgi:hypothetical protein